VKYQYEFDIDTNGAECSDFEPYFASYSTIQTFGNTLEELLDNASIGRCDQDGGDFGDTEADEAWMQELVELAYWRKLGHMPIQFETFGDFKKRMESL
jgi:hypothetical protein